MQVFSGGWDSHDYLERGHSSRIKSVDKPMAALIKDLKQRGMLKDTLVIWTGEFGRTPDNNKRGGVYSLGRGHNADAMTMLLAGGGVKPGSIVGATPTNSAPKPSTSSTPFVTSTSPSCTSSAWKTTSLPTSPPAATNSSASSAEK